MAFDEWLSKKHLARFVVEVVDDLDLSVMSKSYRGSGSASYHPAVLLSLSAARLMGADCIISGIRPQIARRPEHAEEGVHLFPGVVLREASAHGC